MIFLLLNNINNNFLQPVIDDSVIDDNINIISYKEVNLSDETSRKNYLKTVIIYNFKHQEEYNHINCIESQLNKFDTNNKDLFKKYFKFIQDTVNTEQEKINQLKEVEKSLNEYSQNDLYTNLNK